jgi:hypothetical protein
VEKGRIDKEGGRDRCRVTQHQMIVKRIKKRRKMSKRRQNKVKSKEERSSLEVEEFQ